MLLWNAALDQAAPLYPNLHLFDWASVVQRAWYAADAIHYTPAGYTERARLIADALTTIFPALTPEPDSQQFLGPRVTIRRRTSCRSARRAPPIRCDWAQSPSR